MELSQIIHFIEERANEIAEQEIVKYNKSFPEINLSEEAKSATRTRALSHLTLQLSNFKMRDGEDIDKQFDAWLANGQLEALQKTCRRCLDEEANKIRNSSNKNLSHLDAYLKKHLGDIHKID